MLTSVDLLTVVGVVILIIVVVFYIPLCIYGIYKYFVRRNDLILRKHFSYLNLVWASISFATMCSLQVIISIWTNVLTIGNLYLISQTFGYINIILIFYVTVLFLWRCYMNFYSIQYSNSIDTDHWKQLISNKSSTNNWFILHKSTYGNIKYWQKYVILVCVAFTSIIIIMRLIFNGRDEATSRARALFAIMFVSFCVSICVVLIGILYCKTPYYGDIFFIHQEIKYLIINWTVGTVVGIFLGLSGFVSDDETFRV